MIASASSGSGSAYGRDRLQLRESDLRLGPGRSDQAEGDLVDVDAGVAEQALVDVADLLDVDVAEGDPAGRLAA